jgi:methyl-accepting chemotaxis protein
MAIENKKINLVRSIKGQLLLYFVLVSALPLLLVGGILYNRATVALQDEAFAKLAAAEELKKTQIEKYFAERQADMAVLVQTVNALRQDGFDKLTAIQVNKSNQVKRLFQSWEEDILDVSSDPGVVTGALDLSAAFDKTALGLYQGKAEVEDAGDGSDFSAAHFEQHGFFSFYTDIHGYKDALIIDPAGDVVYTVHKSATFGANLTEAAADNPLAKMYAVLKDAPLGEVYLADAALFEGDMAMFIGTPIYSGQRNVGILAYELSLAQLNGIVQDRTGLGETGETYLIARNADQRVSFRSDMLTMGDGKYVAGYDLTSIAPDYVLQGLAGESGTDMFLDTVGQPVMTVYAPLGVTGLDWAVITKMDAKEILTPHVDGNEKDFFTRYKEEYGYYDLFLISDAGFVFYSVEQEKDYGTNMLTGPFQNSNLGRLTANVLESGQFGFADFAPYEPSGGVPAAFIAQPVMHNGQAEAVVALQLPLQAINSIMQERTGMGETGETYLVGPEKRMRSDSYLDQEGHSVLASFAGTVEDNGVDTVATQQALSGQSGEQIIMDYNGNPVLSVYDPLQVYGTQWAIIAEMDEVEAFASARQMLWITGALLVGFALAVAVIAYFIAARIAAPIMLIAEGARLLAVGDAELTGMDWEKIRKINLRKDELGVVGQAFGAMIQYFKEMAEAAQRIADGDLTADVRPKAEVDTLGNAFKQMIAGLRQLVGEVSDTSMNVSAASMQLSSAAEQSGQATQQIAASTQEQATAISQSAHITDQMAAVIESVAVSAQTGAQSAARASTIAQNGAAVIEDNVKGIQSIKHQVDISAQRVQEMGQRSEQIGTIVETIDDIASQTNLLALNAAIEAARAGEHGKGFAVVAEEVRKLAEKSAGATKEITNLVRAIQNSVGEAVTSMDAGSRAVEQGVEQANKAGQSLSDILQAVEQVHEQVEQIAGAAEEMTASSSELVESMNSVSAVVEENSAATEEMSAQVEEVTASAQSLNAMADQLTQLVSQFKLANARNVIGQFESFKLAHTRWVDRLAAMLAGKISLTVDQIVSSTECTLGQWYHNRGRHDFGHLPEFEALGRVHDQLHELCGSIVTNYNQGNEQSAQTGFKKMESLSKDIISLLDAMENHYKAGSNGRNGYEEKAKQRILMT